MIELAADYTIVLVTHNLAQATRVSDHTAFFAAEYDEAGSRRGRLVEHAPTADLFASPRDPRTQDYLAGRST